MKTLLTYYYQVHSDFNIAKSIDTLANIDSSVILLSLLDPQLSTFGPEPDERIVYCLPASFPFNNWCWIARNWTLNLHILTQAYNFLHLFLLGNWRT